MRCRVGNCVGIRVFRTRVQRSSCAVREQTLQTTVAAAIVFRSGVDDTASSMCTPAISSGSVFTAALHAKTRLSLGTARAATRLVGVQ